MTIYNASNLPFPVDDSVATDPLANSALTAHVLDCLGGPNRFARDSDICRGCQKYHGCAEESLSYLRKICGLDNLTDLLIRHDGARNASVLRVRVPPQVTSAIAPTEQPTEASAIVTDIPEISPTITESVQRKTVVLGSSVTHKTDCELVEAMADLIDSFTDGFLSDDEDEFNAFLGKLTVAPATSISERKINALLPVNDEALIPPTDDKAPEALVAVAETVDDAELELVSTITVNDNPVPPRFRNAAGPAPFHVSGEYIVAETQALRQRQMDDLIYLSKQNRSYSAHRKYEGLFITGGDLNMRLAGIFIDEKAWTLEKKACDLLGLTEFEQLQCSSLASKKVNDKWRNAIKHAAKVKQKLKAQAEQNNEFRQYVDDFTKLAQAAYLCHGWDAKTLPLVFGWLTGKKPITRQGIEAKIKRLEKRLALFSSD